MVLGALLKLLQHNTYVIIRDGDLGDIEFEGHIYDMVLSTFIKLEDRDIIHISIDSKTSDHKMFITLSRFI